MKKFAALVALALLALCGTAAAQDVWFAPTLHGGVTHSEGFAAWKTDLVITNAGSAPVTVSVEVLGVGASGSLTVAPGAVTIVRDVVRQMGLADGSYAVELLVPDPTFSTVAYFATHTPFNGGRVEVQLPPLNERDTVVLPLLSAGNARSAVYVAAEDDASWRVTFLGGDQTSTVTGMGGGLTRLVPPAWAVAARFERVAWTGPGGWKPERERAAAYVTFADNVTNAPSVVQ